MSDSENEDADDLVDADTSDASINDSDTDDELQESSSDEEEDDDGGGHGIWMPIMEEDPGPNPIPFTATPGIKDPPPQNSKPIDYFNLFLTPEIVNKIVTETNVYSQQWIEAHRDYLLEKQGSTVHKWIKTGETTEEEFRAFIGVVLNMGLTRKSSIYSYWDTTHRSQATPWFNKHFSRDRFQLLLKFMHFNDNTNQPPPSDPAHKLYKIQPIVEHFNRVFLHYYHPGMDVSIDEGMMSLKRKPPHLQQFVFPKNHVKFAFGTQLWRVCDSQNGYTSFLEVYKGRDAAAPVDPRGAAYARVMRMMTACNFLHQGHHLAVDSVFSSPVLFLDLYQQGTTATGIVSPNRRGLPGQVLNQRLRNHETAERRKGPLLCVMHKFGSNKPVFLSTAVAGGFEDVPTKRGPVQRPKVVVKWNKSIGGVDDTDDDDDLSDARLYKYLTERQTMKWTNKVAFSIFGRAVLNSYILYDQHTTDKPKLSRYEFIVQLVESLAGNHFPVKVVCRRRTQDEIRAAKENANAAAQPEPGPGGSPGGNHVPRKLPVGKNRDCAAGHPSRKRTSYECPTCDVGLCIPYCFADYHRR